MAVKFPPTDQRPDYYSTKEFAALFGRSRRWALLLLEQGKITTVRFGTGRGQQWIPSDQIEVLVHDDKP